MVKGGVVRGRVVDDLCRQMLRVFSALLTPLLLITYGLLWYQTGQGSTPGG